MRDLRYIFSYLGKYRKDLYIAIFLIFIETCFELVIPMLMASLIDDGVAKADVSFMLRDGLLMIICALLALFTGLTYARFSSRAAYGLGANIREAEYRRIQSFSFSNIDRFSSGSLITRLTSDATIIQNAIIGGLRPLVRSPVMLFLGIFFSFQMNDDLALIFLVVAPALGLMLFFIIKTIAPRYEITQKALDKLNEVVEENLRAIRTVKAFVTEDEEKKKFYAANDKLRDITVNTTRIAVLNLPAFQSVMYITIVMIMLFGGRMILSGSLTVGALTGFLSYVLQVLNSLVMFSNVFLLLSRSLTSSHRIMEVLKEESTIKNRDDAEKNIDRYDIAFEDVYFKYSESAKEYTLSDINLKIEEGSTVGILGQTGSGKSTLVQLISRLYDVSKGSIKIGGRDIREYDITALRENIVTVLQKNTLFSGSIRDNIRWGKMDASDEEIINALKKADAYSFVMGFPQDLSTDLEQGGVNVSGGQKQRLAIARALIKNPRIIIFDDSLSAVDTKTEMTIRAILKQIENATKIFISQRISTVMNSDMIVVLDNGRIADIGNHDELIRNSSIYREIYSSQLKGGFNG
ncbi:MAG TPA: ABC transporter ATP-binding protein/permease [Candidatus Ornithospirochaeta avicola]|uniref:ABC transporter ATP-binding protein/permease n=1 Tax=Candidatus Ornithospirochaeta avicola TaxID=2840896 RepID=A0A9D1TN03_9SPIO|nr:ABC transporter ATP-binding protein/permease [Candidatus Ornithospirochaeta avicola]